MGKDIAITEAEKEGDWKDKALAYLKDSGEQILKGNYTDKVTLGGTAGEVLLGIVGVDLPLDIRDLVYDVTHFKWNWKCLGMLAIDVVALLPVIGAIKYSDEVVKLTKRWTKNLDGKVEIAADAVTGFGKKLKGIFDSGAKKVSSATKAIITETKIIEGTKKAKEILEGLRKKIFKGGLGSADDALEISSKSILKNGKISIDDIKANPKSFSGKTTDEIAAMLKDSGYDVTIKASTKSKSGAEIIKINNPGSGKNITQVQVSLGGGRHDDLPYIKISTSDQGLIKIVDGVESIYKTDGLETATIIFTGGN